MRNFYDLQCLFCCIILQERDHLHSSGRMSAAYGSLEKRVLWHSMSSTVGGAYQTVEAVILNYQQLHKRVERIMDLSHFNLFVLFYPLSVVPVLLLLFCLSVLWDCYQYWKLWIWSIVRCLKKSPVCQMLWKKMFTWLYVLWVANI